jgi:hypothetical protein
MPIDQVAMTIIKPPVAPIETLYFHLLSPEDLSAGIASHHAHRLNRRKVGRGSNDECLQTVGQTNSEVKFNRLTQQPPSFAIDQMASERAFCCQRPRIRLLIGANRAARRSPVAAP